MEEYPPIHIYPLRRTFLMHKFNSRLVYKYIIAQYVVVILAPKKKLACKEDIFRGSLHADNGPMSHQTKEACLSKLFPAVSR